MDAVETEIGRLLSASTDNPRKVAAFRDDVNFVETALQLIGLAGGGDIPMLARLTAIVFKPDAIVSRTIVPALDFLRAHGFAPVRWATFAYDRNMIRNAWRYQINIATGERLRVVDHLLSGRESLYVLLRREEVDVSASFDLTRLKGSAHLSDRTPDCLRSVLGNHNTFLNKVHIPDDTADLVRELSIYFGYEDRQALLVPFPPEAGGNILPFVAELEARHDDHSFDIDQVVADIRTAVAANGCTDDERQELLGAVDRLSSQGRLDHDSIDLLLLHARTFRDWDLTVLLTQYVQADRAGAAKVL